MNKTFLSPLFILAALLISTLTSCSDENGSEALPADTIFDMVTYTAQNSNGAVFSLIRNQDSPEVTLVAAGQHVNNSLFPVGCRMIIAYKMLSNNTSDGGNITLYGGASVINGKAEAKTAEETDNFDSKSIRLTSVWLTGNYLNFEMLIDCTTTPQSVELAIDEATIGTDNPMMYLIVKADDTGSSYWKQFYASFNLDDFLATGADRFSVTIKDNQTFDGNLVKTFLINNNKPLN